ncbi:MAG: O-antigen ligase family protein [Bacteroidaceae bacterium]|nr:O-antigen ligase family protein [Bacteroidaceae bacterium]
MRILKRYNLTWLKLLTCLIFFTTPLESIGVSEDSSSLSIVKMVILAQFALFLFTSSKFRLNPVIKMFIALGVYWLLSCFWAFDFYIAFENLLGFYFPSLFLMVTISESIKSKEDIRNILFSFVIGCIVLALNCHFAKEEILANALYADQERVTALGQDQNELSFMLNMGIAILFHAISSFEKKFLKLTAVLILIFLTYAILLTGSRTGFVTTILIFCCFAYNNKRYGLIALGVLLILLPFVISLIPVSSIERLLETKDSIESGDFTSRGTIWRKGYQAFLNENIFLGVGYQNFTKMMERYYSWSVATHNTYLSYLFTGGMVGFIFLGVILASLVTYCSKLSRNISSNYCFAYLIPILIAMFTLETQYRRWIFLIAIILYKAYELSKKGQLIKLNENM